MRWAAIFVLVLIASGCASAAEPTVGQPSGGSPNLWGDVETVELPRSGLTARVAALYWQFARRGDKRLAVEPDIPVALTASDFFAGRDPVLARALALP